MTGICAIIYSKAEYLLLDVAFYLILAHLAVVIYVLSKVTPYLGFVVTVGADMLVVS